VEVPLLNTGGKTVQVTSIESACGCTTPTILPMIIGPGKSAMLSLVGTPLSSGERTVDITIKTDSSISPILLVHFKMISDRQAPFVHGIAGELYFSDESSLLEERDIIVNTVELAQKGKSPVLRTDLPILVISSPSVSESPYDEGVLVGRTYKFKASIRDAGSESFTGKVWVEDPWHASTAHSLVVSRIVPRRVQVVPTIVNIELDEAGAGKAEMRILL
jgi:hypothetical protein